jgi:hypothetical protein
LVRLLSRSARSPSFFSPPGLLGFNVFRPQTRRAKPASLGEPDAAVNNFPPHCRSFVVLLTQCVTVSRSRRSDFSHRDSCRLVSASGLGRCAQLLSCLAFVHLGLRSGLRLPASGGFLFEHSRSLSLSVFVFNRFLKSSSHQSPARHPNLLLVSDSTPVLRHAKQRFAWRAVPPVRFRPFQFLVRLVGSIDFHRSSLVRPGFWLRLAACRQTTSHRCCCVSGLVSSGSAKNPQAPPAAPVSVLVSPAEVLSGFSVHSMRASVPVQPCR